MNEHRMQTTAQLTSGKHVVLVEGSERSSWKVRSWNQCVVWLCRETGEYDKFNKPKFEIRSLWLADLGIVPNQDGIHEKVLTPDEVATLSTWLERDIRIYPEDVASDQEKVTEILDGSNIPERNS